MDKLLFTALASINNQANARVQITNSLANVSTAGFKDTFSLIEQPYQIEGPGTDSRVLPGMLQEQVINLSPGALNMTGNVMDIALNDKTVLGIQAGNGEVGFTRRGDLRVSATGLIENAVGQLILGESGPISVPQGQLVSISQDGTVRGKSPTEVGALPMILGQLMLRDASEMPLTRRADGLFQPLVAEFQGKDFPTGAQPVSLVSGALEGSNVNPVEAMIKMMDISRSFESKIKTIAEIKSVDESGASMLRLPQ